MPHAELETERLAIAKCAARRAEVSVRRVAERARRGIEAAHVEERRVGEGGLSPPAEPVRSMQEQIEAGRRIHYGEREQIVAVASRQVVQLQAGGPRP